MEVVRLDSMETFMEVFQISTDVSMEASIYVHLLLSVSNYFHKSLIYSMKVVENLPREVPLENN